MPNTTCKQCGVEFERVDTGRGRPRLYCTSKCGKLAGRDSTGRVCREVDCDRPVRAKGVCNMHYRRTLRAAGRIAPDAAWTDQRRDSYHRRRALKAKAATGAPVILTEIAERDSYRCGLCAEPVDMSIAWPDPQSKSLDHVIPLSLGGAHDPTNTQLAHLFCNVSKGNRVA